MNAFNEKLFPCWNVIYFYLNTNMKKYSEAGKHLNDPDSGLDPGKRSTSIRVLTGDTVNVFHRILHAIVYIRNFKMCDLIMFSKVKNQFDR